MLKLVQYMYMQDLLMKGIHVAWKKRFNTALKYKFIWFSSRPSSRPFKTLFGECLKKNCITNYVVGHDPAGLVHLLQFII